MDMQSSQFHRLQFFFEYKKKLTPRTNRAVRVSSPAFAGVAPGGVGITPGGVGVTPGVNGVTPGVNGVTPGVNGVTTKSR